MTSALSHGQLQLFLEHIAFPPHYRAQPPSPAVLKALHIHVISALPYENLTMHYDPAHFITLDPQHLFRKVVLDKRGRGGFCLENGILYNHVLRAMGFDAYPVGARSRLRKEGVPAGNYPGWAHIVNIVTFPDGSRYASDVAFGGDGPTIPLPLQEGLIHHNLGTQQIRLMRDWLPDQIHRVEDSRQWIYQYRNSTNEDVEWNSFYAFTEVEFLQPDWNVLNHWICSHADSNQGQRMLIIAFLRRQKAGEPEHEQEIYGKRMLVDDVVKENLGGRTQVMKQFQTEDGRVEGIRELFGIILTAEERHAILGRPLSLAG